jgi:hypothetical protein
LLGNSLKARGLIADAIVTSRNADAFQDSDPTYKVLGLVIWHKEQVLTTLQAYLNHKHEDPSRYAVVLLPEDPQAIWHPLLKGMQHGEQIIAPKEAPFRHLRVYFDAARTRSGPVLCHAFPAGIQQYHVKHESQLTFVFPGKVAGLHATILWDSGAAQTFLSRDFVLRHNLPFSPASLPVALADGSRIQSLGTAKVKVQIQKYAHTLTCRVVDLVPGFDVMLGDDWSTYNKVIADYANHSLWLQTKKLKLIPPFNESKQETLGEDLTPSIVDKIVQNMHPTFHVSALRPYKRSGPYQPPPLPQFIDGTPEWEVAFIVDSRMRGKTREYLVRWQGWADHDGWEPLRNLANCAEKIQEFWQSKGQACPHPLFLSQA